jgi:hypothetical protein
LVGLWLCEKLLWAVALRKVVLASCCEMDESLFS